MLMKFKGGILMGRKIVLYNTDGSVKTSFINEVEAKKYCDSNKICNPGWITRSLNTGEKFYLPNEKPSTIYSGYEGRGMYVKWAEE